MEPCCWKTYTTHRETEEVLSALDKLDEEQEVSTEENYRRFGWEDDFHYNRLSWWQRLKPQLWAITDQPTFSKAARVFF